MSRFQDIRRLLDLTQEEMAEVLGCVQSNVSFLDRGQTITPDVARSLIAAGEALGLSLTFDQVYGAAPLPQCKPVPAPAMAHDWPQVLAQFTASGWTPVQVAARVGARLSLISALSRGELSDAPHAVGCALLDLLASGAKPTRRATNTAEA